MGSYYYLYNRKCPHCGKTIEEIIYGTYLEDYNAKDEWMGNHHECEHCGKRFSIDMKFILRKIDD